MSESTIDPLDWKTKRCVILDMDGTIYVGAIPIEGAVSFIQTHWNDLDFYFLSNNTSKSSQTYITRLNKMGIPAKSEQLLSPVTPLVQYLRKNELTCVYPVGNNDFKDDLKSRMPEIQFDHINAQAVLLAYDTDLNYEKLSRSALLLQKPGVQFLATHPDLVCPSPEGPLPDVGSFIELYHTATGRRPQQIFGKPDPAVLAPLLAKYEKKDMIMVGDRLSTDKKLAENAGIDFALVLSGEATLEDLAKEEILPRVVLPDLGCAAYNA